MGNQGRTSDKVTFEQRTDELFRYLWQPCFRLKNIKGKEPETRPHSDYGFIHVTFFGQWNVSKCDGKQRLEKHTCFLSFSYVIGYIVFFISACHESMPRLTSSDVWKTHGKEPRPYYTSWQPANPQTRENSQLRLAEVPPQCTLLTADM